jgi:hypothetical protein
VLLKGGLCEEEGGCDLCHRPGREDHAQICDTCHWRRRRTLTPACAAARLSQHVHAQGAIMACWLAGWLAGWLLCTHDVCLFATHEVA